MRKKVIMAIAALCAAISITPHSMAEHTENISISDGVQCFQENGNIYVTSENDQKISVYTAEGSLKSIKGSEKTVHNEQEFADVYPSDLSGGDYYEVFVWESNMQPIIKEK